MEKSDRPYEKSKCPKCGALFTCSASAKCWCYEYDISEQNLAYLDEVYNSCLCPSCLNTYTRNYESGVKQQT